MSQYVFAVHAPHPRRPKAAHIAVCRHPAVAGREREDARGKRQARRPRASGPSERAKLRTIRCEAGVLVPPKRQPSRAQIDALFRGAPAIVLAAVRQRLPGI